MSNEAFVSLHKRNGLLLYNHSSFLILPTLPLSQGVKTLHCTPRKYQKLGVPLKRLASVFFPPGFHGAKEFGDAKHSLEKPTS